VSVLTNAIPAPYRWAAYALLIAGVFGYGWLRGANSVQGDWDADVLRAQKASLTKQVQSEKITIQTITEYVDRVKVVHVKGDAIIKEVPIYVKADNTPLSGGFRVLFDAAARNEIPDASTIADEAPIAVADVASATVANFTKCHEQREQLIALQDWIEKQQQNFNGG